MVDGGMPVQCRSARYCAMARRCHVATQSERALGVQVASVGLLLRCKRYTAPRRPWPRGGADAGLMHPPHADKEHAVQPLVEAREPEQQSGTSFGITRRSFYVPLQPRGTGRPPKEISFNTSSFSLHSSRNHGLLKNGLLLINGRGYLAKPRKSCRPVSPEQPPARDDGGIDASMRYQPEQRRAQLTYRLSPRCARRPAHTYYAYAQGGY